MLAFFYVGWWRELSDARLLHQQQQLVHIARVGGGMAAGGNALQGVQVLCMQRWQLPLCRMELPTGQQGCVEFLLYKIERQAAVVMQHHAVLLHFALRAGAGVADLDAMGAAGRGHRMLY